MRLASTVRDSRLAYLARQRESGDWIGACSIKVVTKSEHSITPKKGSLTNDTDGAVSSNTNPRLITPTLISRLPQIL